MIYWTREVAGWTLVALGLMAFLIAIDRWFPEHFLWAVLTAVIGVFLFRGGIHLLKVAVAARVCREAQERLYANPALGSAALPAARPPARAGWRR
jgi:hypothetical protein